MNRPLARRARARLSRIGRWGCPAVLAAAILAASAPGEMVTRRWGTAAKAAPGQQPKKVRKKPPTGYVARADKAPEIDGRLDEKAWEAAQVLELSSTLQGGSAAQPTEVRCLRDDEHLYIAFRCVEPLTDRLAAPKRSHDGPSWQDDSVEMFLGHGGTYWHFIISASGSTYDGRGKGSGWNSQMTAAVDKAKRQWTAEVRVPLAGMTGKGGVPAEWIANFNRNRRTSGSLQEFAWSPTYSDSSHSPNRFGKLLFKAPPPPKKVEEEPKIEKKAVTIHPASGGEGVVVFDLADLKGKRIHRADLLIFRSSPVTGQDPDALVAIEIYALADPFKGGKPKARGEPLGLRAPWFDRFDATAAVRRWAKRGEDGSFFVKTCPRWNPEGTCLDVSYEGTPKDVPPQASKVKLLHRAGQTFVSFAEAEPLVAREDLTWGEYKRALASAKEPVSYRVYAHDKPITASNLHEAERVGRVAPLSVWNINGRNREYLIGQAMIETDEIGELARHYNSEMRRWGMNSVRMDRYPLDRFVIDEKAGPLPAGSGLYVHHPPKAGKRYYAVTSVRAGVENTTDLTASNAPRKPVSETTGAGVPVRQGKGLHGPFFDYPGTRWVYVQWAAPPLAPRPNMYFNWSVLIPPGAGDPDTPVLPGMESAARVPAELYFHPLGFSYAQPGKKLLLGSIQIATHDYPDSGWYGYNDAAKTLKSYRQGKVGNHTQQRIIAFLEWAKKEFPLKADEIIAVGADGAAALALNYPDMFAYVRITGFERYGVLDEKAQARFAGIWGPSSPEITDDRGRGSWSWAHLDKLALAQTKDLPLFTCLGHSWGRDKGYAKGNGRFYRAMQEARQPLIACWGWNGARNLGAVSKYTGRWWGHRLTRKMFVPAVSDSTRDHGGEQSGLAGGGYNWRDVVDQPDKFQVTLAAERESTFDFTPRRVQRFKIKPGEKVRWKAENLPGGRRGGDQKLPDPQNGHVTADDRGVIEIKGLKSGNGSGGVAITLTRMP